MGCYLVLHTATFSLRLSILNWRKEFELMYRQQNARKLVNAKKNCLLKQLIYSILQVKGDTFIINVYRRFLFIKTRFLYFVLMLVFSCCSLDLSGYWPSASLASSCFASTTVTSNTTTGDWHIDHITTNNIGPTTIGWLQWRRARAEGQGSKNPVFLKTQPSGFFCGFIGFCWVFLDQQEKIGKIIQKLSNLKP